MTILELIRKQRVYSGWVAAQPAVLATLEVPTANLAVTESGITATMRPPFSRLTGHYPWKYFTGGLAALRVLTLGEECETTRTIEFALGLSEASSKDARCSNRIALEESDIWCADVDKMVAWGQRIARLCPYESVAKDLQMLPSMPAMELDRYVMTQARWLS
jgi:hypothetical protein